MSGFIGSGQVFGERIIAGVGQGIVGMGNSTQFSIKENAELKTRMSKKTANYGSALDAVSLKSPADISVTFDDVNADGLQFLFLGEVSNINVSSAAVTNEAVTVTLGKGFITLSDNISAITITDVTDTTTYTAGADYEVTDAELGIITILDGGAITDGQVVHVNYTYAAKTGLSVAGGTNADIRLRLYLNGTNLATQKKTKVVVAEAVFTPQEGVDFQSEEFVTIPLQGIAVVPEGATAAYTIDSEVSVTAP